MIQSHYFTNNSESDDYKPYIGVIRYVLQLVVEWNFVILPGKLRTCASFLSCDAQQNRPDGCSLGPRQEIHSRHNSTETNAL